MYLVTINPSRALMHLAFASRVNAEEARRCRAEVQALLPMLKPGFCLLTDLSALAEMDVECADDIGAVMEGLRNHGVSQIVRVIPDLKKDIGFTVMSYFHYTHDVRVQTVESLSEGLKAIES